MNEFAPSVLPVVIALLGLLLVTFAIRWYLTIRSNSSDGASKNIMGLQEKFSETYDTKLSEEGQAPIEENSCRDITSTPLPEHDDQVIVSEEAMIVPDASCSEDAMDQYDAIYLTDCPVDKDGCRIRLNRNIVERIRILTWFHPNLSVSSYVNNVLREHFRINQSVLEEKTKGVSTSITDNRI